MRQSGTMAVRPAGPGVPPSGLVSLRRVLHVVFRRKWLILLLFLICAPAASLAVLHLSKTRYEAVAQMLVAPGSVQMPTDGRVPGSSPGPDERMARAIQLLTGRSLAEQVVEAVGAEVLYPDLAARNYDPETAGMVAVARLMKNLWVDTGGRSSIISVGFRHEDPQLAARIPNLLGDLYIDRYLRVEQDPQADAFFEDQLAVHGQKLIESEQALEAFRVRHGIGVSLLEERKLAAAELANLRASLAETRIRHPELTRQLEAINTKMAKDSNIPKSYYQIRERIAELETLESELSAQVTAEHPRRRDLREQIRGLNERLQSDQVDSAYSSAREQEESNVNLQTESARIRGELEAVEVRQAALSARVEEARRRVESLDQLDSEFNQLQIRVKSDQEAHRLFLSKAQDVRMANMRDAERLVGIRNIEEARPPSAPLDSRTNLKLLAAVLASLVAALGSAFLLQIARSRLETGEDVERVLGLPLLGSISELRAR